MTDVEGVRNLLGTGLVDFVGGIITAIAVFFLLMKISAQMTLIIATGMLAFTFLLQKVFRILRPMFRERSRITAEVTGRLTESIGGVRVVKGYHAEGRETSVLRWRYRSDPRERDEVADHYLHYDADFDLGCRTSRLTGHVSRRTAGARPAHQQGPVC